MKTKTTLIDHSIRVKLKLNCMEYCVMDFYSNSNKHPEVIEYINFLGINCEQVFSCINSLINKGLLKNGEILDKWKNEFKKESSIDEKIKDFKESIINVDKKYNISMLEDFFNYWAELNKSKTKMRWELEKTWDLNKRLVRWSNNNKGKNTPIEKEKVNYIIK